MANTQYLRWPPSSCRRIRIGKSTGISRRRAPMRFLNNRRVPRPDIARIMKCHTSTVRNAVNNGHAQPDNLEKDSDYIAVLWKPNIHFWSAPQPLLNLPTNGGSRRPHRVWMIKRFEHTTVSPPETYHILQYKPLDTDDDAALGRL